MDKCHVRRHEESVFGVQDAERGVPPLYLGVRLLG